MRASGAKVARCIPMRSTPSDGDTTETSASPQTGLLAGNAEGRYWAFKPAEEVRPALANVVEPGARGPALARSFRTRACRRR